MKKEQIEALLQIANKVEIQTPDNSVKTAKYSGYFTVDHDCYSTVYAKHGFDYKKIIEDCEKISIDFIKTNADDEIALFLKYK